MKVAIILLILMIPIFAGEKAKREVDQSTINEAWINTYQNAQVARQLFRKNQQDKTALTKLSLQQVLLELSLNFKKLGEIQELYALKATISKELFTGKQAQPFQQLLTNLALKYGHPMSREMIGMGTSYISQNGFDIKDKFEIQAYLPRREHKLLKELLSKSDQQAIKIGALEYTLKKDSPEQEHWITINKQLDEYADIVAILAQGDADPSHIIPIMKSIEQTFAIMVEAKILNTKKYLLPFKNLPKETQAKINQYTKKIEPLYGTHVAREMMANGTIHMFKELINELKPIYDTNQFRIYLPKEHFDKVSKIIEDGIKQNSQKVK